MPGAARDHQDALDVLSRDIRRYTAAMFKPDMPHAQADLLASLIEEEDFTASLGETLCTSRAPRRAPAVLCRRHASWSTRRSPRSSRPYGRARRGGSIPVRRRQ